MQKQTRKIREKERNGDSTTLVDVRDYFRFNRAYAGFVRLLKSKNIRRNEIEPVHLIVQGVDLQEEEVVVEEAKEEGDAEWLPGASPATLKGRPADLKTSRKRNVPRPKPRSSSKRPKSSPSKSGLFSGVPALFDRSILYMGHVHAWICAEQMDPERKNTKLLAGPKFLPDDGIGVLKMHMWQQCSEACVFLRDAHVSHHGQLDTVQQEQLVLECQKLRVSTDFLFNHQSHTDGTFVKVLNGGTEQYREIFEDIKVDPTAVVSKLLEMEMNNGKLLSKKQARNTISIDLGYGNQSYEHISRHNPKNHPLSRPVLIHDKGDAEVFYQNAGCLMDRMTHGLIKYCQSADAGAALPLFDDQRFLSLRAS
jgi:hypothetical protein